MYLRKVVSGSSDWHCSNRDCTSVCGYDLHCSKSDCPPNTFLICTRRIFRAARPFILHYLLRLYKKKLNGPAEFTNTIQSYDAVWGPILVTDWKHDLAARPVGSWDAKSNGDERWGLVRLYDHDGWYGKLWNDEKGLINDQDQNEL